ncbi:MAG: sigma-54-dependent Fis family transcriptional regulator [Ignavibacteriae bacterium]|nr:sigma-54-dependent Fis family transcriptional regulator [Ignavibacteriota bacterium]
MTDNKINILIVEDEAFDVKRIQITLQPFEEIMSIKEIVSSGKDTLKVITENKHLFDVIILDYQISGGLHGEELIEEIKKIDHTIQVIVITKMTINQSDLKFATQLIESGASWFGTKNPTDIDFIYQPTDFVLAIKNAYEKRKLEIEKEILRKEHTNSQSKLQNNIEKMLNRYTLIGESNAMKSIKRSIETYAKTEATVLIIGESGTGKELVARNIHYVSQRKFENFVPVNCSAIPNDLIESELFGYEKGSFTDAKDEKPGLFEQANNGTIFLDEISELPLMAQAKLLRVLENGELDKIGRKKSYGVNVRVIAATNKNIELLMREKQFREDLYYRLNILNINLVPLRDRKDDITLLLFNFIDKTCNEFHVYPPKISEEALKFLTDFHWPGNIRQLKNVVQRLILMNTSSIYIDEVEAALGIKTQSAFGGYTLPLYSKEDIPQLKEAEFEFKKKFVQFVRNNSRTDSEAAHKLGLARSNFHRLCKELGFK